MTIPAHILERSRLLKQKITIIKEALEQKAMAELPFQELEEKMAAILEAKGLGNVNHNTLRDLRHKARKKHGLPNDGINYPESRAKDSGFRARLKVAYEVARERKGLLTGDELREEVKRRMGGARSIGTATCRMVLRKVEKEVFKANGQRDLPLAAPAPKAPMPPEAEGRVATNAFHPVANQDFLAALDLLVPTLNAVNITRLVLQRTAIGGWEWDADQRSGGAL